MPSLGIEFPCLLLNGVEGGDPLQRLAGDLALPVLLQLEELASGVGLASAWVKHRHRGFIGMQHRESEELFLQGIHQGLKIWPTHWASVD